MDHDAAHELYLKLQSYDQGAKSKQVRAGPAVGACRSIGNHSHLKITYQAQICSVNSIVDPSKLMQCRA